MVETKTPGDATPEEEAIREVNTGIYAFAGGDLLDALGRLTSDNAQGELYLPDVLPLLRADGKLVGAHTVTDPTLTLGVNNRVDLARVRALAQARIHREHGLAGVTIVDPREHADRGRRRDRPRHRDRAEHVPARRDPHRRALHDRPALDADRHRGRRRDARRALLPRRRRRSAAGVSVGPFAYLRPNAHLHDRAKAGTFVEIKNSEVGEGTKVPHLSYIGDADIGAGSNVGAGTITANYDGANKHRTTIGSGVKVSVHTSFVAPVTVGDGAYTGAGSVITDDVPPGRAGDRPRAPAQRRGLRRARSPERAMTARAPSAPARTLRAAVSLDPHPAPATSLEVQYGKRLMLFSGRANPELADRIGEQARRGPGRRRAQDVRRRRGLLPLPGVDPRRRRLHRPAHVREPGAPGCRPTTR